MKARQCKVCGKFIANGLYAQMRHSEKHPIPYRSLTKESLIDVLEGLFKSQQVICSSRQLGKNAFLQELAEYESAKV